MSQTATKLSAMGHRCIFHGVLMIETREQSDTRPKKEKSQTLFNFISSVSFKNIIPRSTFILIKI